MKNDFVVCAWALASCLSVPAWAATADDPASPAAAQAEPSALQAPAPAQAAVPAAAELMRLQEDTVVLKAQLKKLDAQAEVAQREQALDRMGDTPAYDDVRVMATQSLGNRMWATMSLNDGSEVDARPGDTLPNGLRIIAIHSGSVLVERRSGKRSELPVWSAPAGAGWVAAQAGGPSTLRPFPTLPSLPR
jgi:type IV pilus biogenesis protein PilP